jgi:hypothetical protein
MSSGAIESWANGFPVLFTHWAKSHTGNSLYSNKMIWPAHIYQRQYTLCKHEK